MKAQQLFLEVLHCYIVEVFSFKRVHVTEFWLLSKKKTLFCFLHTLPPSLFLSLSLWSSVLPGARWTPAVPLPVLRRRPEQLCNKYRCSRDSSHRSAIHRDPQDVIRSRLLCATGSYMDNITTSVSNKSDANMEHSDSQGSNDTIKITPQFAHHFKPKVSRSSLQEEDVLLPPKKIKSSSWSHY